MSAKPDLRSLREKVHWIMERLAATYSRDAKLRADGFGGWAIYVGEERVARAFTVSDGCWSITVEGDQHA